MQGKDYLSGPDSVFLLAEDDFHKMDIAGLYIFDAELDPQRVIGQLKGYLENLDKTGEKSFARMKSRIVLNKSLFGRPYFELDPKFSVENHFEQHFLDSTESAESSRTSLGLLCGDLLAQGNDWNLPPWKMYLISNLQLPSGQKGCAMFWKLHHAMADGEGTIRPFVHYLAGLDENGNPRGGEVDVAKFQYQVTGKRGIPGSKPGNLEPADGVQTIADDPMFKALQQFALWLIFGLAIFVMNLFQLAVSGFRKSYWSKNGFIKEKQLGFSNPLPMKKVKRVKNALGCTVNDLMVGSNVNQAVPYLGSNSDRAKPHR